MRHYHVIAVSCLDEWLAKFLTTRHIARLPTRICAENSNCRVLVVSFIIACYALIVAGCSGDGVQRAEVSGTVTLNGELVREGSINFFPTDGAKGPEAGGAIVDGKYHIPRAKGPVVGMNRVELRAFQKTGKQIQDPTAKPGTMTEEIANIFPPEFNRESVLKKEIQPGKNTDVDFKLRLE
jgi:hypothetical protein